MPFIPPMLATRLEDPRRLADPRYIAEPKLAHVSPVEQGSAVEVRELLRAWAGFRKICSDRDQTQYS